MSFQSLLRSTRQTYCHRNGNSRTFGTVKNQVLRNAGRKPIIGLALGSGSAKGWAHIGVIRALEKHGIYADVVCGTSIGSLIGGAYAAGKLDIVERFCESVNWKRYVELTDPGLLRLDISGLISGDKIAKFLIKEAQGDLMIEDLNLPYAAVATDLRTGKEVWIQKGSLAHAIRSSIAIPGVFSPVKDLERSTKYRTEWVVDGALVNPVPVSLCRALGADIVIAVNLNRTIAVGTKAGKSTSKPVEKAMLSALMTPIPQAIADTASSISEYITKATELFGTKDAKIKVDRQQKKEILDDENVKQTAAPQQSIEKEDGVRGEVQIEKEEELTLDDGKPPHLLSVVTQAINIMQHRIVTSRLAGDPAEIELTPRLPGMDTFDFEKTEFAINCGYECVENSIETIKEIIKSYN